MNKLYYVVLKNTVNENYRYGVTTKQRAFQKLTTLNSKGDSWIILNLIEIDDEIYNLFEETEELNENLQ